MSTTFTVDGITGAIIIALVICAVYVLVTKRSSWSFPKVGVSNKKQTSESQNVSSEKNKEGGKGEEGWFMKYLWSIVLAVVGAGIFWKLYTPGLRFSQLGDWSWNNWLWLLAFWGVLVVLIALNKELLGAWAKTLQSTAVVAIFLMFLGVPAGLWVRDIFLPIVICPDASALEKSSCLLNVKMAVLKPSPKEDGLEGKRLCTLSGNDDVEFEYVVNSGGTFWLFRAKKETVLMTYRLMDSCPMGRRL